mmetsp:Transcript_31437/g.73976  ORF Transcript_31437/g.73976 Transcript_31437/m.73976 type:complete len:219 (+) Transcript_31437:952-1608(+)
MFLQMRLQMHLVVVGNVLLVVWLNGWPVLIDLSINKSLRFFHSFGNVSHGKISCYLCLLYRFGVSHESGIIKIGGNVSYVAVGTLRVQMSPMVIFGICFFQRYLNCSFLFQHLLHVLLQFLDLLVLFRKPFLVRKFCLVRFLLLRRQSRLQKRLGFVLGCLEDLCGCLSGSLHLLCQSRYLGVAIDFERLNRGPGFFLCLPENFGRFLGSGFHALRQF